MLDPKQMSTPTLEANMHLYGFDNFRELDDREANRLGEILIEWASR